MILQSALSFLLKYKWVILFYGLVILLIYLNRKKFEIQAKIIAMYKTKWGISAMDFIAERMGGFVRVTSYIGIYVGFLGMAFILFNLIYGVALQFSKPESGPTAMLLLPGITVPLWYPLIAIFILAVLHEFSHGVVARAYKLEVQSTGIVFFGPIIGAFVEPNEKKLKKRKAKEQLSIFAAGPFSNIMFAVILFVFLGFGFAFPTMNIGGSNITVNSTLIKPITIMDAEGLSAKMLTFDGLEVSTVEKDSPADKAGLKVGDVITGIDGIPKDNLTNFTQKLFNLEPNKQISLQTKNGTIELTPKVSPSNSSKGLMGVKLAVKSIDNEETKKEMGAFNFWATYNFIELMQWIIMLNFMVGLINLLPLGPVDGGRMFYIAVEKWFGKKKGEAVWKWMSFFCLFLIFLSLAYSYIRDAVMWLVHLL